jgi:hypothetical protein
VTASRRRRGDELGALRAETDLAEVLLARGELVAAAEMASACGSSASRRKLHGLAARADLVAAAIDVAELRLDAARASLDRLLVPPTPGADTALDADGRAAAALLRAEVEAWSGVPRRAAAVLGELGATDELRDEIDIGAADARLALASGDAATAFESARAVAVRAERAGRAAELAAALSLVARFELARGNRAQATAAATRAAREGAACGLSSAHVGALLTLAALARDDGELATASAYGRDASERAAAAGQPALRLAAIGALETIAGGEMGRGETKGAAATMSQAAIDAATRMLADLGLTAVRPYRVVSQAGTESFVADASADLLRLNERSLAIDGVRESILRNGDQLADLRRRSLLKRLLFLFAAQPGKIFSKEDIVQTVWNVEYHPLRHDAALFTNIMRIRRLLGEDGAELIRVSEDGYRFVPPKDFVFIAPA